jgi:hypothetical protein
MRLVPPVRAIRRRGSRGSRGSRTPEYPSEITVKRFASGSMLFEVEGDKLHVREF